MLPPTAGLIVIRLSSSVMIDRLSLDLSLLILFLGRSGMSIMTLSSSVMIDRLSLELFLFLGWKSNLCCCIFCCNTAGCWWIWSCCCCCCNTSGCCCCRGIEGGVDCGMGGRPNKNTLIFNFMILVLWSVHYKTKVNCVLKIHERFGILKLKY